MAAKREKGEAPKVPRSIRLDAEVSDLVDREAARQSAEIAAVTGKKGSGIGGTTLIQNVMESSKACAKWLKVLKGEGR